MYPSTSFIRGSTRFIMSNLTTAQYKAYANDIVGFWYNEEPDGVLVFSFLCDYTQQSDLLIISNSIPFETTYSIKTTSEEKWILEICNEQNNKTVFYFIEVLNARIMALQSTDGAQMLYIRKTDTGFADKILKKFR